MSFGFEKDVFCLVGCFRLSVAKILDDFIGKKVNIRKACKNRVVCFVENEEFLGKISKRGKFC